MPEKNVRPVALSMIVLAAACGRAAATPGLAVEKAPPQASVEIARAETATLIMVDDPACHYCRRWNKEVGGGYSRTAEGLAAPLKRVGRDSKILAGFAPVIYAPTFILAQNGRELGRITGYPGQLYFWEELSQMMSSAGINTKG
jgi:hypothetical protein